MYTSTLNRTFFFSSAPNSLILTVGAKDILSRIIFDKIRVYFIDRKMHRYFEYGLSEVSYTNDSKRMSIGDEERWLEYNGISIMIFFKSTKDMTEFKLIS